MKELIKRFKSETPYFFKQIRSLGLYLLGVSSTILIGQNGIEIPEVIITIAKHIATAGFIMSTVSTFAKVDSPKD